MASRAVPATHTSARAEALLAGRLPSTGQACYVVACQWVAATPLDSELLVEAGAVRDSEAATVTAASSGLPAQACDSRRVCAAQLPAAALAWGPAGPAPPGAGAQRRGDPAVIGLPPVMAGSPQVVSAAAALSLKGRGASGPHLGRLTRQT